MKRESQFYWVIAGLFLFGLALRSAIFGFDGLFIEREMSFGSLIDGAIIALEADYMAFVHMVNPYAVIVVIALLTQAFVMSLSACLAFLYPDLRDIHSRAHLHGQALIEWHREHGINPLVVMVSPMFRVAVLIAVMMVFIRPLDAVVELAPSTTEYCILILLYFPAILPQVLISKIPIWQDSSVITHLLVGGFCLLVVPYAVFVYFTTAALCHMVKVLALHIMEPAHEANSQTTH